MGNFNEIQKGMPDLGKTYWQEFKEQGTENSSVVDIVKINCQTIFNPDDKSIKMKPSIFEG